MQTIQTNLTNLSVGPAVNFMSLTMIPLSRADRSNLEYDTLDEAMDRGICDVEEVSEGGSVPTLKFLNSGDKSVFLLDGEELVGAKQNRVLNLSILVPENSEIEIPVSCVEQGRWRHNSRKFKSSMHAQFAKSRAKKARSVSRNMRVSMSRHSDQGEVWRDISAKAAKLDVSSETDAMADVYRKERGRLRDFVETLSPRTGQLGAIFVINGKIAGLDIFDSAETYAKLSAKLIRSHALDAIEVESDGSDVDMEKLANGFLEQVSATSITTHPAIGLGTDHRIEDQRVTGGALVVDGEILHIAAFPAPEEPMEFAHH